MNQLVLDIFYTPVAHSSSFKNGRYSAIVITFSLDHVDPMTSIGYIFAGSLVRAAFDAIRKYVSIFLGNHVSKR